MTIHPTAIPDIRFRTTCVPEIPEPVFPFGVWILGLNSYPAANTADRTPGDGGIPPAIPTPTVQRSTPVRTLAWVVAATVAAFGGEAYIRTYRGSSGGARNAGIRYPALWVSIIPCRRAAAVIIIAPSDSPPELHTPECGHPHCAPYLFVLRRRVDQAGGGGLFSESSALKRSSCTHDSPRPITTPTPAAQNPTLLPPQITLYHRSEQYVHRVCQSLLLLPKSA